MNAAELILMINGGHTRANPISPPKRPDGSDTEAVNVCDVPPEDEDDDDGCIFG